MGNADFLYTIMFYFCSKGTSKNREAKIILLDLSCLLFRYSRKKRATPVTVIRVPMTSRREIFWWLMRA